MRHAKRDNSALGIVGGTIKNFEFNLIHQVIDVDQLQWVS